MLKRKLRKVGGALVVCIPKPICDMYNFKDGDWLEISPIGGGEFKIKKVDKNE